MKKQPAFNIALALIGIVIGGLTLLVVLTNQQPNPESSADQTASVTTTDHAPRKQVQTSTLPMTATTTITDAEATTDTQPEPEKVFFDPQRFSYEPDFYVPEIQHFLSEYPGPLKDEYVQVGDQNHSFAEVLVKTSTLYSLNPTILLALLEQQSALLSTADPTEEQLAHAMGFAEPSELYNQFNQAAIELRLALRDYAVHAESGSLPPLIFQDGTQESVPSDIHLSRYVLSRLFAKTNTPDQLPTKLTTFFTIYTQLFGDPQIPPDNWSHPSAPFLTMPMERKIQVTSFFDHDTPFLQENGQMVSFWGIADSDLPYDGHPGWDYGMLPPDKVLAAADGSVVFAGNSHDGCETVARAVILDHHNGYRTLYWHLDSVSVEMGQDVARGTPLGIAGETGCAQGPHLHFQVQYLGRDVDPYGWCNDAPDVWANNPAGQASTWLWKDMPAPCGPVPPGAVVVDNTSSGFTRAGDWQDIPLGYNGDALYTVSTRGAFDILPWQVRSFTTPSVAIWKPTISVAGRYRVLVYIPYFMNGLRDTEAARYRVLHSAGDTEIVVDDSVVANGWADLGTYEFQPGEPSLVSVSTLTADHGRSVWVDAVMWLPEQP
jgi:murein DD-endopeptidase MepM/ murein hydrolase activator NlpD